MVASRLLEYHVLQGQNNAGLRWYFIVGRQLDVGMALDGDHHFTVRVDHVSPNRLLAGILNGPLDNQDDGQ